MDYDDCYSAPILHLTPPVYLMKSQIKCYLCGNATDVFALAANGFKEEDLEVKEFSHFSNISSLPEMLELVIKKYASGFYFDYVKRQGNCYYVNHCSCRAKLSEHLVHSQEGAGFYPVNAEQAAQITLYEVSTESGLDIRASYVIHDEDLISTNALYEKAK